METAKLSEMELRFYWSCLSGEQSAGAHDIAFENIQGHKHTWGWSVQFKAQMWHTGQGELWD